MHTYTVVAGEGLGVCQSSLGLVGQAPVQAFGALAVAVNVATGNVVVSDSQVVHEAGGTLSLGVCYNSQGNWQLTSARRLLRFEAGVQAVLLEADGHESIYRYENGHYVGPGEGKPWFCVTASGYSWHHPLTHVTEVYDAQGFLLSRSDAKGATLRFSYDASKRLERITCPSGTVYRYVYGKDTVEIYADDALLQRFVFDRAGHLVGSFRGDGYEVGYRYSAGVLTGIAQTDGSQVAFSYQDKRLERLKLGDRLSTFHYADKTATVSQGESRCTYTWDDAKRLVQHNQANETQIYAYDAAGLLQTWRKPNGAQEQFGYTASGLLEKHEQPLGCSEQLYYSGDYVKARVRKAPGEPLQVERYVYEGPYLRYLLSSTGTVTAYAYNARGLVSAVRVYTQARYPLEGLAVDAVPSIETMEAWEHLQPKDSVSLTTYDYDAHGEVCLKRSYAKVDSQGMGIADESMGEWHFTSDRYGQVLETQERQQAGVVVSEQRRFDSCGRLTRHSDGLGQVTTLKYTGPETQKTLPNGRVESRFHDRAGACHRQTQSAEGNLRATDYERDEAGRVVVTHLPDGRAITTLYDEANRLRLRISATGQVESWTYTPFSTTHCQYAKPIDVNQLREKPTTLPTLARALALVKPDAADRADYRFYDAKGRLAYTVDAERHITEQRYTGQDKRCAKVCYADKLEPAQLEALLRNAPIALAFTPSKDRLSRAFYDADNRLLAEQDGAGYVTEYVRNAAGWITKTLRYFTPAALDLAQDFATLRPAVHPKDSVDYHFYDAKGQCSCEVDAEGYISTHTYLAGGLKARSVRYATRVDKAWYQDPSQPPVPVPAANDRVMRFSYDALGREISREGELQAGVYQAYDVMGHEVYRHHKDLLDPKSIEPSKQTSTRTRYDGFDALLAKANPFVAQAMYEIENNPSLSPQQKVEQLEALWQSQSVRYTYDKTKGLKLNEIDPLGNITWFYYDSEARLCAQISCRGALTTLSYNSFNECELTRKVKQPLSDAVLQTLAGGFITPQLQALFTDTYSQDDAVIRYGYNAKGERIWQQDAEGYETQWAYNAFGECEREAKAIASKTPTLITEHRYEGRGLKTQTHIDGSTPTTVSYAYANPLGKLTQKTTPLNGATTYEHDSLGQVVSQTNSQGIVSQTRVYDAFSRVVQETDAAGNSTVQSYKDNLREATTTQPDGSTTRTTTNIHGKALSHQDELGATERFAYAPDGQITVHTDSLSHTHHKDYNRMGWCLTEVDANGIVTKHAYNPEGGEVQTLQDAEGEKRTTTLIRDVHNKVVETRDAKGIRTVFSHDKKGRVTHEIIDPSDETHAGLNLLTTYTYNGQDNIVTTTKGDAKDPKLWQETKTYDEQGRFTGTVQDPGGLKLTTAHGLNAAGQVIVDTNAKGIKRYTFYNGLGQKAYTVDATGAVLSFRYYPDGRLQCKRSYATALDINLISETTSLETLQQRVQDDAEDGYLLYLYDVKGRSTYTIDSLGRVEKTLANPKGRVIQTTCYATKVPPRADYTLEQLSQVLREDAKDRTTHRLLDVKGQERFVVDAKGYVIEKRFDNEGRVIAEIGYYWPVKDPAFFAAQPVDKALALIAQDPVHDRHTYHVFDNLGRPEFTVSPEQSVTEFKHDAQDKLIQECQFKDPIKLPASYEQLVILLRSLTPQPGVDRITSHQQDAAGRTEATIDATGAKDSYQYTAVGDIELHTDREDKPWRYAYDKARRLIKETAPKTLVTTVKQAGDKLVYSQAELAVEKQTVHDALGNTLAIIEGANTDEPRTFNSQYDANNRLNYTQIDKVGVNDTAKPASLTERPESLVSLSTQVIYNAKGLEVAKRDEAGFWSYQVYDSEGQLAYSIDKAKVVTGYIRNAFGEVEEETRFATPLNLDLSPYSQTGIPLSLLQSHITPSEEEDRVTRYERDQRGDVIITTQSAIFFYDVDQGKPYYGWVEPQTRKDYDAFRQCVAQERLINPKANTWSCNYYWYNREGKVWAEVSPRYNLILQAFNGFGELAWRKECVNTLKSLPSPAWDGSELDKVIDLSPKDRTYSYTYTLLGLKEADIQHNVVCQQLKLDGEHKPSVENVVYESLVTARYAYNKIGAKVSVTDAAGNTSYNYVDARGAVIAKADIPRMSYDEKGAPITLIPLTYYGINAHGQTVMNVRFKQGTAKADLGALPIPMAYDAKDQYQLEQINNLGLVIASQDAEMNVHFKAYGPTRKLLREWHKQTNWLVKSHWEENKLQGHVEETRYGLDAMANITWVTRLHNNQIFSATQTLYNGFNERILEGAGDGNYAIYWHYDRRGYCWSTNADAGKRSISLTDTLGYETVKLQAPDFDISLTPYTQLDSLLTLSPDKIECTQSERDAMRRVIAHHLPAYFQQESWIKPINRYGFDVWDNIIWHRNSKQQTTAYTFSALNKLELVVKPPVTTLSPEGETQVLNPWMGYGYNVQGFQVSTTNSYSAVTGYALNQAGQQLHVIEPDGTFILTQVFNALGQIEREQNASWASWVKEYNRNNQLTAITTPLGRRSEFYLNEINQRFLVISPSGTKHGYNFNGFGKIEARIEPNNAVYEWQHDIRGNVFKRTQPSGANQVFWRDYHNRLITDKDIGDVVTHREFNWNLQVKKQTTQGAKQRGQTLALVAAKEEAHQLEVFVGSTLPVTLPFYTLALENMAEQSLEFEYTGQRLRQVRDNGSGLTYDYEEDTEGNRTQLTIKRNNQTVYKAQTQHDALSREISSVVEQDGKRLKHEVTYNLEDSIVREVHAYETSAGQALSYQDMRFTHDHNQRVLRQMTPVLKSNYKDIRYSYEKGLRNREQFGEDLPRSYLFYDLEERLCRVDREYYAFTKDRSGKEERQRMYGSLLNLLYHPEGYLSKTHFKTGDDARISCNENGWLLTQHDAAEKAGEVSFTDFTTDGMPVSENDHWYFKKPNQDDKGKTTVEVQDYLHKRYLGIGQEWQLKQIEGLRQQSDDKQSQNSSVLLYDVNGYQNGVVRWNHPAYLFFENNPFHKVAWVENTPEGLVLRKGNFDAHGYHGNRFVATSDGDWQHFFYSASGRYLGGETNYFDASLGDNWVFLQDPVERNKILNTWGNYADMWDVYYRYSKTHSDCILTDFADVPGIAVYSFSQGRVIPYSEMVEKIFSTPPVIQPVAQELYAIDPQKDMFSTGVNRDNGLIRPQPPQYHEVQEGDSFETIAKQYRGSPRLARAIARANGYLTQESPPVGYKLLIPWISNDYHAWGESDNYGKARAAILSGVEPFLMIIPKEAYQNHLPDQGDDFMSEALSVFVPIVIGVLLGPAGPLASILTSAFSSGLTAAFVTGALSSAISQGILIGIGVQHKFSLVGVLESAVLSAYNFNLGQLNTLSLQSNLQGALESIATRLTQYGLLNATEQLGLILAGQQDKFDVGAMFNAAVTQTASAIISTQPNETVTDKLINSYQSTVVSDMSSSILLGQPPTPMGLAAHLAGSALGTLVTAPREIAWQRQKQQEAYHKTKQAAAGEGTVSEEHKAYGMKPQPKPKKPSFFGPGIPEHGIEDMDLGFHELTVDDAFNGYQLELMFSESDTTKAQRWQQEVGPSKSKTVATATSTLQTDKTSSSISGDYLNATLNQFARYGVDASLGYEYASGQNTINWHDATLPDQIPFLFGRGLGYLTNAIMVIEGAALANSLKNLALRNSGKLITKVSGLWSKQTSVGLATANEITINHVAHSDNILFQILEQAKPTPGKSNQLEKTLEDGTKVIFRRDIGEHAHPIGKAYREPVDHYNIEVHSPHPTRPGKYIPEQNAHIIIDKNFNLVEIILKNKYELSNSLKNNPG